MDYDEQQQMYMQAEQQFEILEENKPEAPKDEMNKEEKEKRRQIMDAQLKCKQLVYMIHQKDVEIEEIKREIETHKQVLEVFKSKTACK